MNAQYNEEIQLPGCVIKMKGLLITKPLLIVGQPNCVLQITEGPISINISENYENEVVKFSQVKIVFDICETEKSIIKNFKGDNAKFTVLFRLYPGSLVEVEDCDITCNKDTSIPVAKHKLICFQLLYCKYIGKHILESTTGHKNVNNPNVNMNNNRVSTSSVNPNISHNNVKSSNVTNSPTILTIISSRIEKFYQTIRSAENCIINIEKSFINKNIGKSLCVLNPLIMKVVGSTFEGNGDNPIHLKFVKDDNLLYDSRKLFFKNNEINYNYGTGIYIDGIENFIIDLDCTMESNMFKKNKGDGVFMLDLFVKSLVIRDNKFIFGKSNGLNLNKVYYRSNLNTQNSNMITWNSYTQELPVVEIKENEFVENEGFGIFMNDSRAQIVSNNFFQNRGCGLLLINIAEDKSKSQSNQNTSNNLSSIENNNSNYNNTSLCSSQGGCFLSKNSFVKNGGSGLRMMNYIHFVTVSECLFRENVEFGVHLEIENHFSNSNSNVGNLSLDKIKAFRSADNTKIPKDTHFFLLNSTITNNMKSGIYLNNCFIFMENTIISDNLDYAIYVPKEEYRFCYKQSKSTQKNMINGSIGGPWGEITITNRTLCNGCTSTTKIRKNPVVANANLNTSNANNNYVISQNSKVIINNKVSSSGNFEAPKNQAYSDNSNAVKTNKDDSKCEIF